MVGVVPNNMAYPGAQKSVDYSTIQPFNNASYYHTPCAIDYNNASTLTTCWEGDDVVALPDLRTEDSAVANIWATWVGELVSNYTST